MARKKMFFLELLFFVIGKNVLKKKKDGIQNRQFLILSLNLINYLFQKALDVVFC